MRPNDQEVAVGVQHEILPRVALDFQWTRHAFGNFVASQNTSRPPSAYNEFCVTAPGTGLLLWSGDCQIDGRPSRMPWAGPT